MRWMVLWPGSVGLGGSERRMLAAYRELSSRNQQILSVHLGPPNGPFIDQAGQTGALTANVRSEVHILRLLSQKRPDIVWHMGLRTGVFVRALKPLGSHYVLWSAANGLNANRSRLGTLVDRFTTPMVDRVVANSDAAGSHVMTTLRVPVHKVSVVSSGLDSVWIDALTKTPRNGSRVRVAMIGNARPEKRQRLGLDILNSLSDREVDIWVYTNDASRLVRSASTAVRNLGDRLRIVEGKALEPHDFQEIDILLHPSSSESLPTAILEARSQGCFVVTGRAGDSEHFATHLVRTDEMREWVDQTAMAIQGVREQSVPPAIPLRSTKDYVDDLMEIATRDVRRAKGRREPGQPEEIPDVTE